MDLIYVILVFWTWSLLQVCGILRVVYFHALFVFLKNGSRQDVHTLSFQIHFNISKFNCSTSLGRKRSPMINNSFQFPFVRTSKKSASEDIYDGDTEDDQCQNKDEEQYTVTKRKVKYFLAKIQYTIRVFLETEGWAIFVSLIMQDGPFFIIRIISIFYYNILTYTNYFFAAKNALILALQMYRIVSIYLDYKVEKQKELKEKRNLHNFKPKFMDYTDLVKYTRKK